MKKKGRKRKKDPHLLCILESEEKKDFQLKGKLWIEGKEGTFLGCGRIALLERIKKYGSISKAAKSMNMSYKHAWDLINSMNRQAKTPLVETKIGGKKGGGTRLTEAGEKAIQQFKEIYREFQEFLNKTVKKLDL